MASITNDPNGRKRILVVLGDERVAIRLGKCSMADARTAKAHVEHLVAAKSLHTAPSPETTRWAAGLSDGIYARLSRIELLPARDTAQQNRKTLGAFMVEYFAAVNIKESTKVTYHQTERVLLQRFGAERPISSITAIEADQWRQWQKAEGLAESTIARRVKSARQMWKKALRWKLVSENIFADVTAGSMNNKARMRFINMQDTMALLGACPDAQWRLIVALTRFAGLRCPSETLLLTWGDVNWERGRIRVKSPKTEHLEGRGERFVPIFAELRPYLLEVFEQAEPGTERVITRYRDTVSNLRTQIHRIMRKAGLTPWPKPFHNMRSTRQTELVEHFPINVVCDWLGNTRIVAQDHYLQTTEAHYQRACNEVSAAQKAAQYPMERVGIDGKMAGGVEPEGGCNSFGFHDLPSDSEKLLVSSMTPAGFEPALPA